MGVTLTHRKTCHTVKSRVCLWSAPETSLARILVIEDDEETARQIVLELIHHGYQSIWILTVPRHLSVSANADTT